MEVRKKLLQEAQLTLQRCVDICGSTEATKAQVEAIGVREEAQAVLSPPKEKVYAVKDSHGVYN